VATIGKLPTVEKLKEDTRSPRLSGAMVIMKMKKSVDCSEVMPS
jgi:hypothetical protein